MKLSRFYNQPVLAWYTVLLFEKQNKKVQADFTCDSLYFYSRHQNDYCLLSIYKIYYDYYYICNNHCSTVDPGLSVDFSLEPNTKLIVQNSFFFLQFGALKHVAVTLSDVLLVVILKAANPATLFIILGADWLYL